jgi:hypothetical protein
MRRLFLACVFLAALLVPAAGCGGGSPGKDVDPVLQPPPKDSPPPPELKPVQRQNSQLPADSPSGQNDGRKK